MNVELVAEITRWITSPACRRLGATGEVFEGASNALLAGGVPLLRASTCLLTMHPEVDGIELVWRRGQGTRMQPLPHALLESDDYRGSPIEQAVRTRDQVRCRLGAGPPPFRQLKALAEAGATDYVVTPIELTYGRVGCISVATDAAGGFEPSQLATIDALMPILSLRLDLSCVCNSMSSLLGVYLGDSAAKRVLSGSFRRGAGQVLTAAIWFCDMRDFTAYSDDRPAAAVVARLDRYLEVVGRAVEASGGEILKFIGDAVMAVFPVGEAGPEAPCGKALAAARQALTELKQLNADSAAPAQSAIQMGIALHLGEVMFGNIGARNRLDFTITGHAVNEAARLESLSKELGVPLVLSAAFARAAGAEGIASLGKHQLRGVRAEQEVFTLASLAPPSVAG